MVITAWSQHVNAQPDSTQDVPMSAGGVRQRTGRDKELQ